MTARPHLDRPPGVPANTNKGQGRSSATSYDIRGNGTKDRSTLQSEIVIVLVVLACYLLGTRVMFAQDENIVPTGDAFTYTTLLFQVVNVSHAHLLAGLRYAASGNIWLQTLPVSLLSPFLFSERASLIIVNFIAFAITAIMIHRSALSLRVHPIFSFAIVVVFMLMPWNFDGRVPFNLTSLMPEPLFVCSLLCAIFGLSHFATALESRRKAILASIASAAFVLSRGNAIPYLIIAAATPIFFAVARRVWFRHPLTRRALLNIAVALLLVSAVSGFYLYFKIHAILDYYLVHAQTVEYDQSLKAQGASWILFNIPGIFIAGAGFYPHTVEVSYIYYALTTISHVIVIVAFLRALRQVVRLRGEVGFEVVLGITGFMLFYGVLLFSAFSFGGLYADPRLRVMHPFSPVVLGLLISGFMLACQWLKGVRLPRLAQSFALVQAAGASVVVLSAGHLLTISMPVNAGLAPGETKPHETVLRASELRQFSQTLGEATHNAPVTFFWYGLLNVQIVDYYLAQHGMPMLDRVRNGPRDVYVWGATLAPEALVPQLEFEDYMRHVIGESEFIVIPETTAMFDIIWPCPITHYRNEIVRYLDTPSLSPDYIVWAVVQEPTGRVLVLRRYHTNKGLDEYERFPRDWGTPSQVVGRVFRNAGSVGGQPGS